MEYDYDNLRTLLNAVVEQAAFDYIRTLCEIHDAEVRLSTERSDHARDTIYKELNLYRYELSQLDEFFFGDDFNGYTELSGEYLVKMMKEHAEEFKYDLKQINWSRNKYARRSEEMNNGGTVVVKRRGKVYKAFSR